MTDLDPSVLDDLLKDHLSADARFSRITREPLTPLVTVLAIAERELAREVAVYWVDGGAPEMFSLPGLRPAPITFSTRFLVASSHLFKLLRVSSSLSPELVEDVVERFALQLIAELSLVQGDCSAACYLIARSLGISQRIEVSPTTVFDLEYMPKNEIYMTSWFLGLLHEIGHVYANDLDSSAKIGKDKETSASLDQIIDFVLEGFADAETTRSINEGLKIAGISHSLDNAVLLEEVEADLFAVRVLIESTFRVVAMDRGVDSGKVGIDYVELCAAILDMFGSLTMLSRCMAGALAVGGMVDRLRADPWIGGSYQVRAQVLALTLAHIGTQFGKDFDKVHQAVRAQVEDADRNAAYDRGISRAMRHAMFPQEREPGVVHRLTDVPLDSWERMRIEPFLALAKELRIEHPDLDIIRGLCEQPAPPQTYIFLAVWVQGPDGFSAPFGLSTRYGFTIFLFVDEALFYDFYTASRPPAQGYSLERVAVVANTAFDAVIEVAASAQPHGERLRIVVEGTDLFDRLLRSLADDSIWED
ncbi:hypothetical protein [Nocardia brasiliensis]|uniref:hypothetical protein n=1 Tax=Nocardia brasiliensis TaxID=37326 RepID=UPI003D94CB3A